MSSIESIKSKEVRRDTLELKGDQTVATDEKIREHCPEFFEAAFYLNRLSKALESMKFSPRDALKSHLDKEGQQKLDACVSHLTGIIEKTISQIPFEFTVQQASDNEEELPVVRNRDFTVAVSNAEALLKSVKQPASNLDVLHDLSSLIDTLEKRIAELKVSVANPSPREKNSIERSEIEIRVLEAELSDFEEYEKTGKPTTHQRNQKKQLKDDLEKHRGIIRKIQAKTTRKKERITYTQEILDQVVQLFTEFLAQHNPEASPEESGVLRTANFSAELDLTKAFRDNEIDTNHVSAKLNRILQAERTGDYTAYYPEVENQQKWDERKRVLERFRGRFMKWAPRAVVLLALMGGGAYAARSQIENLFVGNENEQEYVMTPEERGLMDKMVWDGQESFMRLVEREWVTDESLARYIADDPKDPQRMLMALKIKAFRDMSLDAHNEDADRLMVSESIFEFQENLALIKEKRRLKEKEDSPEVEALREKILNNPFIKKYASRPYKDYFRTLHTAKEMREYLKYLLETEDLANQEAFKDFVNDLFAAKAEHFLNYEELEGGSVKISVDPKYVKVAKKFIGESVRFNIGFESEKRYRACDENHSLTMAGANFCKALGEPIIRCKWILDGDEFNVFTASPTRKGEGGRPTEKERRVRFTEGVCTPEKILATYGKNSLAKVFTEIFKNPKDLAVEKSRFLENKWLMERLSRGQQLNVLRAINREELHREIFNAFPLKANPLNEEYFVAELSPHAVEALKLIHAGGEIAISLSSNRGGSPYYPGKQILKRVISKDSYCTGGRIFVNVSVPTGSEYIREHREIPVLPPESKDDYCDEDIDHPKLPSVGESYKSLLAELERQVENGEGGELAATKLEVLSHPVLAGKLWENDRFSALITDSQGELKEIVSRAHNRAMERPSQTREFYSRSIRIARPLAYIFDIKTIQGDKPEEDEMTFSFKSDYISQIREIFGDNAEVSLTPHRYGDTQVFFEGTGSEAKPLRISKKELCDLDANFEIAVTFRPPLVNEWQTFSHEFSPQEAKDAFCK